MIRGVLPDGRAVRVPEPGDWGIRPGGGWTGWLTMLGTFGRYGHACGVTGSVPTIDPAFPGGWKIDIVEAMGGGARRRYARLDEFTWSRCNLTDDQRRGIVADYLECIGLPYDLPAYLGFIVRFWGAKWSNQSDDHADDKVICSELVAWAQRRNGHEVARSSKIAPGDVSPNDLGQHMAEERETV
jgi:hypothetical protein